jgi:hypothetical protein
MTACPNLTVDPTHWPAEAIYDNIAMFTNVGADHGGNLNATWNMLKWLWLDFPGQFPYEFVTQNGDGTTTTQWLPSPAGPVTAPAFAVRGGSGLR